MKNHLIPTEMVFTFGPFRVDDFDHFTEPQHTQHIYWILDDIDMVINRKHRVEILTVITRSLPKKCIIFLFKRKRKKNTKKKTFWLTSYYSFLQPHYQIIVVFRMHDDGFASFAMIIWIEIENFFQSKTKVTHQYSTCSFNEFSTIPNYMELLFPQEIY